MPNDAAALVANERIVSVDLAGKSRPAHREISKNQSFRFTLRQFNQTETLCQLILAMLCAVHQLIPRSREPISRSKKSISQKRRRLRDLHANGRVGSRRFQDDFAGGEKRFRRAGGGRGSLMAHGKAITPPAQDWCSERVFAALSAKSHRGRTPSITKTERRRSANLLQTPRGLMCKLRQRGQGYGDRPAGSRGIDPSFQPPPAVAARLWGVLRPSFSPKIGNRWAVRRRLGAPSACCASCRAERPRACGNY